MIPVPRVLQHAPSMPKLFRVCVGVLGLAQISFGIYWLLASKARSSGPAYTILKSDLGWLGFSGNMHGWGIGFLIAGIFIIYGCGRWKPPAAEVGLVLGACILTFFSVGLFLESHHNPTVSAFGPLLAAPLIFFHLAFLVGLGSSRRT